MILRILNFESYLTFGLSKLNIQNRWNKYDRESIGGSQPSPTRLKISLVAGEAVTDPTRRQLHPATLVVGMAAHARCLGWVEGPNSQCKYRDDPLITQPKESISNVTSP